MGRDNDLQVLIAMLYTDNAHVSARVGDVVCRRLAAATASSERPTARCVPFKGSSGARAGKSQAHLVLNASVPVGPQQLHRRALLASILGIVPFANPTYASGPSEPQPARPFAPGEQVPAHGAPDSQCLSAGASPLECSAHSVSGGPNQQAPIQRAFSPTDRLQPNTSTAPWDAQPPVPSANTPSKAQPAAKSTPGANDGLPPKAAAKAGEDGQTKLLLDEEEERRKLRRRKKGRIRELEEIRAELAEKELVLLGKQQELLERDQTLAVLREELELEKKLRTLLTKEKEKAEEEAALAMGLCTGGSIF